MSERYEPFERGLVRLARSLTAGGLACNALVPTRRGDLHFGLHAEGRPLRALLTARRLPSASLPQAPVADLTLVALDAPTPAQGQTWVDEVARRLDTARERRLVPWLDRLNREHHEVEASGRAFLRLLALVVQPGQAFWAGWQIAAVEVARPDPPRLTWELTHGDGRRLRLALDATRGLAAGEARLAETPLGLLLAEGALLSESGAQAHPERALLFLLARALHPEMRWVAPAQHVASAPAPGAAGSGPAEARPAPPDDLVDHCFRSWHQWDARRSRFFHTWGDPDYYVLTALFGDATPLVHHANRECCMVSGGLSATLEAGSIPYRIPRAVARQAIASTRATDVDDAAIVFGGEARLEAAVARAAQESPTGRVYVNLGCDYQVIGDDAAGVCRSACGSGGCQVELLNPPLPRFTDSLARNWWKVVFEQATTGPTPERARPRVNLAGFGWPEQPALAELVALLDAAGLDFGTAYLPGRDAGFAAWARRADLTLLSPWAPVLRTLPPVLAELDLPFVRPAAPYGPAATRAWLDAARAALELDPLGADAWQALLARVAPGLPALQARAGALSLGLVVDRGSAPDMDDARVFFGARAARFFRDLGFRVLVLAPGATAHDWGDIAGERFVAADLGSDEDAFVRARALGLDLVYADLGEGLPAAGVGAAPFGVRDLEPGLAGSARTLRRLLTRARWTLLRPDRGAAPPPAAQEAPHG